MKAHFPILVILASSAVTHAAEGTKKPGADTVFREPFTLKLHVDEEHFYEEKFAKIPYVHGDDVYLFKDDEFGLSLGLTPSCNSFSATFVFINDRNAS